MLLHAFLEEFLFFFFLQKAVINIRVCRLSSVSYPGADLMQAGGYGFGWRVTAKNMTFENPGVFISCHVCKIPARGETTRSTKTYKAGKEEKKKKMQREDETDSFRRQMKDNLTFIRLMNTHMKVNGAQRSIDQRDGEGDLNE